MLHELSKFVILFNNFPPKARPKGPLQATC